MGSAGISFTLLPPEVSAWLGEAMPPLPLLTLPLGVGVGVGVGMRLRRGVVSGITGAGGGGMKDGVGVGIWSPTPGVEMGITPGMDVGEGSGGGSERDGVGVDVAFVVVEMMNVVRGRAELDGGGGGGGGGGADGVGVCEGVCEGVGVFCLIGADEEEEEALAGNDDGVAFIEGVGVVCALVAPLKVSGVPVPTPVCPPRLVGGVLASGWLSAMMKK
ncbi:hypothetical protein CSIM01_12354 [Colletotrichum simmondsii]|uniref:Uncharacterized protein n=1 Tax=Colletotrichum simmondsii TaxID=703756 RepID=A0A135S6M3_9PEZI|nr:hypothetical protein CSIM01_12354 [Colletotrichum simmondsii]